MIYFIFIFWKNGIKFIYFYFHRMSITFQGQIYYKNKINIINKKMFKILHKLHE